MEYKLSEQELKDLMHRSWLQSKKFYSGKTDEYFYDYFESEKKQLPIHGVSNCGDYAKNRPDGIQNDEWWCPNCNEIVPSHDVTNDERHGIEGCMTKVC